MLISATPPPPTQPLVPATGRPHSRFPQCQLLLRGKDILAWIHMSDPYPLNSTQKERSASGTSSVQLRWLLGDRNETLFWPCALLDPSTKFHIQLHVRKCPRIIITNHSIIYNQSKLNKYSSVCKTDSTPVSIFMDENIKTNIHAGLI